VNVLRKNIGALIIFVLFFIAGLIPALLYSKYDIQIYINQFFNPVANNIFLFFTHLAEGWFTIPLLIVLLIYSWRKSLFIGIIYLVSAILAQLLKRVFFDQLDRPHGEKEIVGHPGYNWLPDIDMPAYLSFPSGHTTTAFCIFLGLALLTKNKKLGTAYMIIACIIGFSRTYLSFHFLMDIVAGSLLGVLTTLTLYFALRKKLKI
jgi:membrane-associated phospholipid phosphatase|tara:strand:- start:15936 stop:16550 length:615 start_codon:yes stop_codon:yes gene_type:complete